MTTRTTFRPWLDDRLPTPMPTRYEHARARRHRRCAVPTGRPVFVHLLPVVLVGASQRSRPACRTIALDISLGGMALEVIEIAAQTLPDAGGDVLATLELDGQRVDITARILSRSTRKLRLCFHEPEPNERLLLLLVDLLCRDMRRCEPRASPLANRLACEHFVGSEHLDVLVQAEARDGVAPWWRIAVLDYRLTWTELEGLRSGTTSEAQAAGSSPPTASALRAAGLRITELARARLPEHAATFDFVRATLR